MAEINITPFTDVLLVLLIIFMILAALVTPPGFEKELPNHSNNTSQQNNPKNDIEVIVNNKGVIYVDGTRTDVQGIYRVMTITAIKIRAFLKDANSDSSLDKAFADGWVKVVNVSQKLRLTRTATSAHTEY